MPNSKPRVYAGIALVVLTVAGFGLYRYMTTAKTPAPKAAAAAVPVITAIASEEDIPVYLSGIGTVTPVYSVTVKVRVDGQLEKVAFAEGQEVRSGDLLAQIDPRPFEAQLEQALAQKARDEAQLKNSLLDLDRYTTLWKQDSVSRQIYDTQTATVAQLKATVQADQAQIDTAKLQLAYTTIRAPISGRTGGRLVDPGNIVRAADNTGIVVINQIDPIAVVFTLPEDRFQSVNQALRTEKKALQVAAYARENAALLGRGKLTLVNNQIDTATGTFQLKAIFPNPSQTLWPGQYVNASVVLGNKQRAIVVPATVVQRGPNGQFAFVVNDDNTVAAQPVRVAQIQDGKAVIDEGIAAGTRVVVDGQYKLRAGAKITEAPPPGKPGKTAAPPAGSENNKQKKDGK
jgi:multidrug efflux system membrane fusion protein